jgi:RND family efflux transporter MFP subunit
VAGTAAATLVLLIALAGCAGRGEPPSPERAAPLTVPVARVERGDLVDDLVLTAEFEPFQEVDVLSKVSGYVKSISVDIGDRVREGQVLATLEVPEMEDDLARAGAAVQQADAEVATASDQLRQAQSAHELAHLSFNRLQEVSRKEAGLVPLQQVDEFRSRDLVSEAQVAAARSSLRAAEQRTRVVRAEHARLQTMYRYTTITAPFTGVVTKRYASVGSMIQAGIASQSQAMPVVRLSQNNLLRLVLPVPESAVSRIRTGAAVEVRVPSLGRAFPGRVARTADKLLPSTRTMDTQVDVPNPNLTLVPGMYAEVNLRVDERRGVLAVPIGAIRGSGPTAVYRVEQPGVIRVAPVKLGLETALQVEIRAGVAEGDLVVVGRHAGLQDGARVQARLTEK